MPEMTLASALENVKAVGITSNNVTIQELDNLGSIALLFFSEMEAHPDFVDDNEVIVRVDNVNKTVSLVKEDMIYLIASFTSSGIDKIAPWGTEYQLKAVTHAINAWSKSTGLLRRVGGIARPMYEHDRKRAGCPT